LPDPDDTTVAPEPPALPEPPTIGEICQAAATANIPRPTIGVSPHVDGVTGLETWLWATGTDVVTINATATATAGP
ncbi:MAG: hypothetical protein SGJ13_02500, partial [Actinomycetota bacterium]|nr:hypothetical protein [Actinomycetota bacterium]